jgi:hypothetical protein
LRYCSAIIAPEFVFTLSMWVFSNSVLVDRRRFARRWALCPALASQPPCQFETHC